jgi:hypothetical protein
MGEIYRKKGDEIMKTEIVDFKRIRECPKKRLDADHFIGFKKCGCFKEKAEKVQ